MSSWTPAHRGSASEIKRAFDAAGDLRQLNFMTPVQSEAVKPRVDEASTDKGRGEIYGAE